MPPLVVLPVPPVLVLVLLVLVLLVPVLLVPLPLVAVSGREAGSRGDYGFR
jgi:hypothetical protein